MTAPPVRVLFIASEVESLAKTGGLADVAKALPLALKSHGQDVRLIMPYYKTLNRHDEAELLFELQLDDQNEQSTYQLFVLHLDEVPVYLVKHPYFERNGLYADGYEGYPDNGERFAFFCRTIFQVSQALDFKPEVMHCNDWHTALIPYLLKTQFNLDPFFCNTKSVLTIHNAAYQGIFEREQFDVLGELAYCLPTETLAGIECVNLLKVAIAHADKINAVSPNYAQELLTPLGSHGLHENFQAREKDLVGILNGCDYSDWDPGTDRHIPANYSSGDMSGKQVCRQSLQLKLELAQSEVPIFGMVCRLTEQKGFNLLLPALEKFLRHNVQVVIVGTGNSAVVEALEELQQQNPDKLRFVNAYSNELAHLVEAGADYFMMPSLFEPCGLNQMYSLAYGTLPIVRAVGGLKDTVVDFDEDPENATGHSFYRPESDELLSVLRRALLLHLEHPDKVQAMRHRAMQTRFNWQQSVWQYEALYHDALGAAQPSSQ